MHADWRRLSLSIVPGGPWADRLESVLGALRDAPAPDLGPSTTLVIAAHPSALDPTTILAGLSSEDIVLTHARAADSEALARMLSPAQRDGLRSTEASVYWVDALPRTAPGRDGHFVDVLAATGAALLRGDSFDGCARLDPAALDPERHAAEVDFRVADEPPLLPSAPETGDPTWRRALWRFHRHGEGALSEAAPAPGIAVASVALRELARRVRSPRPWPLRLHVADGRLVATPLAELFGAAADAPAEDELAVHAHALSRLLAQRLGSRPVGPLDASALRQAAESLATSSHLEPERAEGLRGAVASLATAWPEGARLLPLGPSAPLLLHLAAVAAARKAARRHFEAELRALDERLADALLIDALHAGRTHGVGPVGASLGAAGAELIDPAALSAHLPHRAGGVPLPTARRDRLEAAREAIARWLEPTAPVAVHCVTAPDHGLLGLELDACRAAVHTIPLNAAASIFDRTAREACALFAAVRAARLELAGAYRAEIHGPLLDDLRWDDLAPEELAALPAVVAILRKDRLEDGELGTLLGLLRSGRPLQVLVLAPTTADDRELRGHPLDLGYLAATQREVNVVQATLTDPTALAAAIGRMATAPHPGLTVITAPEDAGHGFRWLRTVAPLHGRALVALRHDAAAGETWADRLDVADNPAPEAPWPRFTVAVRHADGSADALELALTYADAVALEPALSHHLRVVPTEAWCDAMVPLDAWVAAPAAEAARTIPYIWTWDHAGGLARAVVTRELAAATVDRARAWRAVQELGGFGNGWVERAVTSERAAAETRLTEVREQDRAAHEAAIDTVRSEAAHQAMARLAAVLLDLEPPAGGAARVTVAPPATLAPEVTPEPSPEVTEDEEDDEGPSLDAAYITSALCTSCNDCIQLDGAVFRYNADKQAVLADPERAPFAVLVKAAEACPSGCIHPGRPRADDPTVTPELVERAKALGR